MRTDRRGFLAALLAAPVLARVAPQAQGRVLHDIGADVLCAQINASTLPYWHGQYPVVLLNTQTRELLRWTGRGLVRGIEGGEP